MRLTQKGLSVGKNKKRERKAGNVRQKKLKTNPSKLIPNSYLCKK